MKVVQGEQHLVEAKGVEVCRAAMQKELLAARGNSCVFND